MLGILKSGGKAEFDGFMAKSLDPATKSNLNFRMRPYGFASYYDTYKAVLEYNLEGFAGQIRCPLLITEPANESRLDRLDLARIREGIARTSHPLMPLIVELSRVVGEPHGGWVRWYARIFAST
jgi:hypothetical protein